MTDREVTADVRIVQFYHMLDRYLHRARCGCVRECFCGALVCSADHDVLQHLTKCNAVKQPRRGNACFRPCFFG